MGTALATVVNLLNPEKVILTGKVAQAGGDIFLNPLFYNLRQRALPQAVNDLPVVVSEIGEEAATIGMVLTAGEELLKARCAELDQQDLTRGTKRQQLRVSARAGQILP